MFFSFSFRFYEKLGPTACINVIVKPVFFRAAIACAYYVYAVPRYQTKLHLFILSLLSVLRFNNTFFVVRVFHLGFSL